MKEGAQLRRREYTKDLSWRPDPFTGTADVERVLQEFERGATIVLQALHVTWEPLAAFCRSLERVLGHPAQANAYYTPRDSKGLAVHHDTHDVFVFQVAGEKRWLVYEPAWPLPLKEQRYSKELGGPGELVHDVTLRSGDSLYLPRGWMHEATTSATDSLHITVGVNVYTWLEAFKAALESCGDEVGFRRGVPDDGEGADALVETLRARLGPDDVTRRRRRRFVETRRPMLGDQLTQLRKLDDLTGETLVERRPTVIADITGGRDGVTLAFEGKEIVVPANARAEAEFAAAAEAPFSPSELPGDLDDEGRLVLVRRLVREGFLRISETGRDDP